MGSFFNINRLNNKRSLGAKVSKQPAKSQREIFYFFIGKTEKSMNELRKTPSLIVNIYYFNDINIDNVIVSNNKIGNPFVGAVFVFIINYY